MKMVFNKMQKRKTTVYEVTLYEAIYESVFSLVHKSAQHSSIANLCETCKKLGREVAVGINFCMGL
jgi:hypothetical protein